MVVTRDIDPRYNVTYPMTPRSLGVEVCAQLGQVKNGRLLCRDQLLKHTRHESVKLDDNKDEVVVGKAENPAKYNHRKISPMIEVQLTKYNHR